MSFSFGFGWAKDDPNSLCMREERPCNENSYLVRATGCDLNSMAFRFEIQRPMMTEPVETKSFRLSDDFEQISAFIVCRLLTKFSDCIVYPDGFAPAVKLVRGDPGSFSMLKSKIGLSLVPCEDKDCAGDQLEDHHYHILMYDVYSCLLDNGWFAFATDRQLRGVVARLVSQTELHVVALTNCTINYKGEGLLNVEILRFKLSPICSDMLVEHGDPAPVRSSALPVWRTLARSMQCVFLPTTEEVQLTATISYVPHTAATCTAAQYRDYEKHLFLTALDEANRARGYSTYLPDTYARARLCWELAYGIMLPKKPAASDGVMFARIQTALGEQTVPLAALARGVAEVPWKDDALPRQVAADIHQLIHTLPCFQQLHLPQRPSELSAALRQSYHTDGGAQTGASLARVPPFVSALRMRDVQKVGIASVGSAFVTLAAAPTSTARPVTHLVVPPAQSAADEENDDASSGFSLFDEKPSPLAPVSSVPPSVPLAQHVAAPTVPENKPSGVTANVKPVIGKAARAPQQTVAQRVSKKPAAPLLENSDSDDFDLGSSGSEAPVSPRRSKQVPVPVVAAPTKRTAKPVVKAKEVKRKKTA